MVEILSELERLRERDRLDILLTEIPSGIILDLGSGVGVLTDALDCIGVDIDSSQLAKTRQYKLRGDFIRADAEMLPFRDEVFDNVICHSVLTYVNSLSAVAAEIDRILKPPGLFLGYEFNPSNLMVRRGLSRGVLHTKFDYSEIFPGAKITGNFDYLPYSIKTGDSPIFKIAKEVMKSLEKLLSRLPITNNLGGFIRIRWTKCYSVT